MMKTEERRSLENRARGFLNKHATTLYFFGCALMNEKNRLQNYISTELGENHRGSILTMYPLYEPAGQKQLTDVIRIMFSAYSGQSMTYKFQGLDILAMNVMSEPAEGMSLMVHVQASTFKEPDDIAKFLMAQYRLFSQRDTIVFKSNSKIHDYFKNVAHNLRIQARQDKVITPALKVRCADPQYFGTSKREAGTSTQLSWE
ncbi:MAG: hypothetical protein V1866_04815 [archaeon]